MQKIDNNPRRDFLKLIPFALVSIGVFSFFKNKRAINYTEKKFSTLSESEADEIIKDERFPVSVRINPSPAPVAKKA